MGMRYLPDGKDGERVLCDELTRARINVVKLGVDVTPAILGKLGRFTFVRRGAYWVVKGAVPINVARILLDDSEGKVSVRVDGYAGNCSHEWLDKKAARGERFVESYHIDDQAGLRLFADTIRQFNLFDPIAEENDE